MSKPVLEILPYRRPPSGDAPLVDVSAYRSTELRHPVQPLVVIPQTLSEVTGPVYGYGCIGPMDHDLTRQHAGDPIGERIVIEGRVLDEDERPVPETLVEVWQANAAGRYAHAQDTHDAPLDRNFSGAGRMLTDADGHFRFTTVKPGAYPSPPAIDRIVRSRGDGARAGAGVSLRHRVAWTRRHTDGALADASAHALADGRALLRDSRTGTGPRHAFEIVLQGPHETVFFDV